MIHAVSLFSVPGVSDREATITIVESAPKTMGKVSDHGITGAKIHIFAGMTKFRTQIDD